MEATLTKPQNINITYTTGRPLFDGKSPELVISKLEYAFSIDCSVEEACCLAMISTSAYYRFLKKRPEFRERFRGFRLIPAINAKITIANELKKGTNYKFAWKYLVAKCPEEFSAIWVLRNKYDKLKRENDILRDELYKTLSKNSAF